MKKIRYVYWQDEDVWLGYLETFPDYMTQGESLENLEEHLRELYADLTSGDRVMAFCGRSTYPRNL